MSETHEYEICSALDCSLPATFITMVDGELVCYCESHGSAQGLQRGIIGAPEVPPLTIAMLRTMKEQLISTKDLPSEGSINIGDIRVTMSGVVLFGGFGFMHLQTFKDIASPEQYEYVLSLPRVISAYDVVVASRNSDGTDPEFNEWPHMKGVPH